MKKLFLLIGLVGSLFTAQAAQLSVNLLASQRTNIFSATGVALTSITFANTNAATALNITLIDNNATNQLYSISQYTNRIAYKTNIVSSWTDINGVTTVMTNDAMAYIDNTVAAYNGNYSRVLTLFVPAATTYTYTPATPLFFGRGVLITNDASVNITATVSSIK